MLKRLYDFQKLFLRSTQPLSHSPKTGLTFAAGVVLAVIMGQILPDAPFILAVGSIWMVNWILNNDKRLFEMVPVSRRFTVFNVYLAAVLVTTILTVCLWLFGLAFVGAIIGFFYIAMPQNISEAPPGFVAPEQVIDTVQGNLLMVFLLIIFLCIGTTIAFIRSKKLRNWVYAIFATLSLALSVTVSILAPVSPSTGKVELTEVFSHYVPTTTALLGPGVLTVAIVVLSIYIGHRLYTTPYGSGRHK